MPNWLRYTALKLHHLLTGRQVLTRLEELNRTQWLDREALFKLQYDKLRRVVEYAYHYVPYYKHTFDQVGFKPANLRSGLDEIYRLPVLTKDIISRNFL
jgi:phenylacetate-CoA ligase